MSRGGERYGGAFRKRRTERERLLNLQTKAGAEPHEKGLGPHTNNEGYFGGDRANEALRTGVSGMGESRGKPAAFI